MAPAVREGLRQTGERFMKVKAAQGLARILKSEGVPWVACYPTNHVNNALGAEDVPILMMREERYAVAVADSFSRVTGGQQIGVCTIAATPAPRWGHTTSGSHRAFVFPIRVARAR